MRTAWILCCALLVQVAFATAPENLSPAEKKISAARKTIADGKSTAQPYSNLAMALARRARETSDPKFYDEGNKALEESFRLAPENTEGLKAQIWILLGQHEFAQARERAVALNKKFPDDLMVYAMLVDANAELGNYSEAEKAAQWSLDLRPGNIAGLTRAAYLRELFGDLDGAIELMSQAYERTPAIELEDRSWLLTQLGHLQFLSGRIPEAGALLLEALRLFPNYHYALAGLAEVRLAENKPEEAVKLLQQRYQAAPHPENLFALAEAQEKAGQKEEAKRQFQEFEKRAFAESKGADNSNRELVLYYVDHAQKRVQGLELAALEMKRRPNVYMLDAYSWALWANEKKDEAREQMEKALAVGVRDPELLRHAQVMGCKGTPSPGSVLK